MAIFLHYESGSFFHKAVLQNMKEQILERFCYMVIKRFDFKSWALGGKVGYYTL